MILFLLLTWVTGTAEASRPPLDPPGKILFIGDSHSVGTFGHTLDGLLRERYGDETVYNYASCGSRTSSWITGRSTRCGYIDRRPGGATRRARNHRTPRIDVLLDDVNPRITIVALGANHMGQRQESFIESVQTLAQSIRDHGSECVWVGPPPGRVPHRDHGLNRSEIQELLPAVLVDFCTFIESSLYVSYPRHGGDGVHFDSIRPGGRALARHWAEGIYAAARPFLDQASFGYANLSEPLLQPEIFTEP